MPRNGSGTYSLPQPPFTPGTTISSAAVNSDFSDIATALTQSIASNGETTIIGQLKFPAGTAGAPSHTFAADLTTGMYYPGTNKLGFGVGGNASVIFDMSTAVGSILQYGNGAIPCPVGLMMDWPSDALPAGWLFCAGQNISRTAYPELFALLGTYYGSGDGSTTFGLMDCRGRLVAGRDNMGGSAAGRITATTVSPNGNTTGATGGSQTATLAQNNLPNVRIATTLTDGTVTTSVNVDDHAFSLVPFGTGPGANVLTTGGNSLGISATATSSLNNLAGLTDYLSGGAASQVGMAVMPPVILMNKIIFAGRP